MFSEVTTVKQPRFQIGEFVSMPSEIGKVVDIENFNSKFFYAVDFVHKDMPNLIIAEDLLMSSPYENNSYETGIKLNKVIFNGTSTIILWNDGTKTIVKPTDGDEFDKYAGFCAAFVKKIFGSTNKAKTFLDRIAIDQTPECEERTTYNKYANRLDKYIGTKKGEN